ncbi:SEC14-like protein 2 isoform X2 [Convolutriloba macropyga]|uniref:SEC14-like protein 2 isoform X2 n=1 Tax=Convolutriloba macropyga TaxID=536237 RepID=UPI003F52714C
MSGESLISQMSSAIATLLPDGIEMDLKRKIKGYHVPQVTDREMKISVDQLRARLGADKVLEWHSDYDLLRFLKARRLNVDETVTMYEQMLAYRRKYEVDSPDFLETFEPLEVFTQCYPNGIVGRDKQGHPVVYDFPGNLDVKGFAMSMSDEEFAQQIMWNLENLLRMMDQMSEVYGQLVDKWTVVIDVNNLGWEHLSAAQLTRGRKVQQLFDVCYPERMYKLLFVNISRYFDIGFKLFRPLLPEATKEKVVLIVKKEELLRYIDADQLPVCYGGTKVDSNGDPECKEWIRYGAKVPSELYKSSILSQLSTDWASFSLQPGKSYELEIDASSGQVLTFYTDCGDLNFGISCMSDGGKSFTWIKEKSKVSSDLQLVQDSIELEKSGSYTLAFDNKLSWCQKKTVRFHYSIMDAK